MTVMSSRVAYVMKRYPRLTETFILNEIAVMEALGVKLELFSLLQPEPPPHHPMVSEIKARLNHLPAAFFFKAKVLAKSHAANLRTEPLRYMRALGRAVYSSLRSRHPFDVLEQFVRAGFIAERGRREEISLLHGHFANAPTLVTWFASAMTGIPYSFTTHAKDLYLTAPGVIRRHVRDAAFVATCTSYNADYLKSLLPQRDHGKVHLVYHGIDLSRLAARSKESASESGGAPLILAVGRLVPKKGLGDLIAACEILQRAGLRFRCAIVGEGPLRATMEADIERRGLAGRVRLMGAMTHADLISVYRKADLFALPPCIVADGDRDGIPNVIAEAMAIGVPVVSTSVSGIPELVEHNVTGLLVPPESPEMLAAALRDLLGDPQAGARLARNARARLESDFDCRETTKALRDLMHGCACGGIHETAPAASFLADAAKPAAQLVGERS